MGGSTPRRLSRRGRLATLALAGACALLVGTTTLSAVAGTSHPSGGGSDTSDDDVGYVGDPSYLDPNVDPLIIPDSVETISVPPVELISRRSDIPGDVTGGQEPSMSADGRYVVFTTRVAGTDSQTTVLLRDRGTGDLYELTPNLAEFPGRSSRSPVISADGCVVAVVTETPYDVFRDDDSGARWDVYRQFMPQCSDNPDEGGGDWELMSSPADGATEALDAVDPESPIAISAGGTVVAFRAVLPGRFAGPDPVGSLFVADATVPMGAADRVVAVPGLPATGATGQYRVSGHSAPALSADGRWVAFVSDAIADAATPAWADGVTPGGPATAQVYAWDRHGTSGRPRLMSADAGGRPLTHGAGQPVVNGDGHLVAFVARVEPAADGGLEGGCVACAANVVLVDRDTDVNGVLDEDAAISRVVVSAAGGVPGDADSSAPAFALDGRLVGYVTKARNLVAGAIGAAGAYVVTDVKTGQTTVVTVETGGLRPAAVVNGRPDLSENGRSVVLETTAPGVLGASVVGGGDSQIVAITSTPVVRIDDVDVGTTFVNEQAARSTTITNAGPSAFVPASIASTSPSFAVAGGSCQVGTPVPAGESCTVDLLFSATTLGFTSSQLVVSEAGVAAVTVAANISGAGGVPKVEADPPTVVFADALVGTIGETLSVVVRNSGNGPTIVSGVVLGGTHPGDYAIEADQCTALTVPDLGACVVRVTFRPVTSGSRSGVLVVTTTDGAVTRATLSGKGFFQASVSVGTYSVEVGSKVRLTGTGFPAETDVVVTWEGAAAQLVRTDATGGFDALISTTGVVPGTRRLVVADGVPAGATPRYEALRTEAVRITEQNSGVDANSPVFD